MSTTKIKFYDTLGPTVQVAFENDFGLITCEHRWTTGEVIESRHTKMCIIGTIDTSQCAGDDMSNATFKFGKNISQIRTPYPSPEEIIDSFLKQRYETEVQVLKNKLLTIPDFSV